MLILTPDSRNDVVALVVQSHTIFVREHSSGDEEVCSLNVCREKLERKRLGPFIYGFTFLMLLGAFWLIYMASEWGDKEVASRARRGTTGSSIETTVEPAQAGMMPR